MTDLNELLGADEVEKMTRSWTGYSATNVMLTPRGELVLGERAGPPKSIPEPGELALIGGFNTAVPGPAMFKDVADFHARDQLGLELSAQQCTDFTTCELPMYNIGEPLKTPFGAIPIKRVVFMRRVLLTTDQVAALRPQGKLRGMLLVTRVQFRQLAGSGRLTFPHQMDYVETCFRYVLEDGHLPYA